MKNFNIILVTILVVVFAVNSDAKNGHEMDAYHMEISTMSNVDYPNVYLLHSEAITKPFEVAVSHFANGLYLITIGIENESRSFKFLKN